MLRRIRTQFLAEAIMLALIGGDAGVAAGALATVIYASTKGWAVVIPALAGLLPALRAARLSPTEALRTA